MIITHITLLSQALSKDILYHLAKDILYNKKRALYMLCLTNN